LDQAKIIQFCRQLFVELNPDWQYKLLLVMYTNWRAGQFQVANGALQVLKNIWNILSEKNREESLHLLASSVETQKDPSINREIVGTLQILHSRLTIDQRQWILHRYFEWLPGKTAEFTAGILDAIRDILEDMTQDERASLAGRTLAKIGVLLDNKDVAITLSAMRIIELLMPKFDDTLQHQFLSAATRILKKQDSLNYREAFLSLKNVWGRFSPNIVIHSLEKLHPLVLKIYQKKSNLEEDVADIFDEFFEDYWESLPESLKSQYY
jgi:hypothetical protein